MVALRAVLRRMEKEYEANSDFRFKYPYFGEANMYLDIMQWKLWDVELARVGPDVIRMDQVQSDFVLDVVTPARRFISRVLGGRGISDIQFQLPMSQSSSRVLVDRRLMTQALYHLLDNAVKYFQGPPSNFRCSVMCRETSSMLQIDVEDNGVGIRDEDVEKIFQQGFRCQDAEIVGIPGSGLGLWLSKKLIERHEGTLTLSHRVNPTVFTIRLPIAPPQAGNP